MRRLSGLSEDGRRLVQHHLCPSVWARDELRWNLDPYQRDAVDSYARNQLWLWGRQTGKSTSDAVLALHQGSLFADSLVLLLSASLRQSTELFRKVVEMYHRLQHPVKRLDDSSSIMTLANGSRIVCLPGSEGTVRGYSAPQLVIMDEAAQIPDALYHAVLPMLVISGGRLVLSTSAFAKIGFVWDIWRDREARPEWDVRMVTIDACARADRRKLAIDQHEMGPTVFAREYYNVFMALQGTLFSPDDIEAMRSRTAKNFDISAWNLPKVGEVGSEQWRKEMTIKL